MFTLSLYTTATTTSTPLDYTAAFNGITAELRLKI